MREGEARAVAAGLDGMPFGPMDMELKFEVQDIRLPGTMVCTGKERSTETHSDAGRHSYFGKIGLWGLRSDLYKYQTLIPLGPYQAQKANWKALKMREKGCEVSIRVKERKNGGLVSIKVQGPDEVSVGAMKVRLEEMLVGERVGDEY